MTPHTKVRGVFACAVTFHGMARQGIERCKLACIMVDSLPYHPEKGGVRQGRTVSQLPERPPVEIFFIGDCKNGTHTL